MPAVTLRYTAWLATAGTLRSRRTFAITPGVRGSARKGDLQFLLSAVQAGLALSGRLGNHGSALQVLISEPNPVPPYPYHSPVPRRPTISHGKLPLSSHSGRRASPIDPPNLARGHQRHRQRSEPSPI